MKLLPSFLAFILILPFGSSCSATGGSAEVTLVGSTPGDEFIKSALNIDPKTSVDFIRWNLILNSNQQNSFVLNIDFGESQPNTSGFKGGGETLFFEGAYRIIKNNGQNINGEIYQLSSDKLPTGLSMIKIDDNLFHLLTTENRLMTGNGGWSYTLNRKQPIRPAGLPASTTELASMNDTWVQAIFGGRTPCLDIAKENNLTVAADCFKLKWKLTLNRDPRTLLPTTYLLQTTFNRASDIVGKWTITKAASNPGAIIYQLYNPKEEKTFSLLAGGDNVLFFLKKNSELYVGNGDFSFTLDKIASTPDHQILSLSEAEQILGEPAVLTEQNKGEKDEERFSKMTFTANKIDAKTGKLGTLYFIRSEYNTKADVGKLMQSFIASNENHSGFELLEGYGDVAFIHTDQTNFITFVAIKENKMVRLKVNQLTSKTSATELKRIAREMISRI
jgi:hypothetical protein